MSGSGSAGGSLFGLDEDRPAVLGQHRMPGWWIPNGGNFDRSSSEGPGIGASVVPSGPGTAPPWSGTACKRADMNRG